MMKVETKTTSAEVRMRLAKNLTMEKGRFPWDESGTRLGAAAVRADVAALGREQHLVAHAELVEDRGDEALVLALVVQVRRVKKGDA